jgi:hypothetical protein
MTLQIVVIRTEEVNRAVSGDEARPSNSADCLDLVVGLVSTLLPEIARRGIASVADVAIDTLKDRILKEAAEMASILIGRSEVGAWCRVS